MSSTVDIRSRRALLGAGVAAVAATAVSAITRPSPVRAESEYVQIGEEYITATSRTRIRNETNDADVLVVESTGIGTALVGASATSTGIAGVSGSGTGVYAHSDVGIGLDASASQGYAVLAQATGSGAVGLKAAGHGSGVLAFVTEGRISFELSGLATITAGQKTVLIQFATHPAAPMFAELHAGSFVLISPNADIGTRRLWWTKNITAHNITIRMSATRTVPTKVSWVLFG